MKAILCEDIEEMLALGLLGNGREEAALCSVVCPSKISVRRSSSEAGCSMRRRPREVSTEINLIRCMTWLNRAGSSARSRAPTRCTTCTTPSCLREVKPPQRAGAARGTPSTRNVLFSVVVALVPCIAWAVYNTPAQRSQPSVQYNLFEGDLARRVPLCRSSL